MVLLTLGASSIMDEVEYDTTYFIRRCVHLQLDGG